MRAPPTLDLQIVPARDRGLFAVGTGVYAAMTCAVCWFPPIGRVRRPSTERRAGRRESERAGRRQCAVSAAFGGGVSGSMQQRVSAPHVSIKERFTQQHAGEILAKRFGIAGEIEQKVATVAIATNDPHGFELKSLSVNQPQLASLGIKPESLHQLGACYVNAGLLRGRLPIPIQNVNGVLVAYAGLALDTREFLYAKTFRLELEMFMLHVQMRLEESSRALSELCSTSR